MRQSGDQHGQQHLCGPTNTTQNEVNMQETQSESAPKLWVGLWLERRHVVFDPTIQPQDKPFVLLYFVEGIALCCRDRHTERGKVTSVRDQPTIEFAIEQYMAWRRINPDQIVRLTGNSPYEIQEPGALNVKCPVCAGEGVHYSRIGTFSDGAFSDGVNQREFCGRCRGHGVIPNIIYE